MNLSSVVIYGGASYSDQVEELAEGCDILIATPGRLMDMINKYYFFKKKIDNNIFNLKGDESHFLKQIGYVWMKLTECLIWDLKKTLLRFKKVYLKAIRA